MIPRRFPGTLRGQGTVRAFLLTGIARAPMDRAPDERATCRNPKTGEIIDYRLPASTNIRRVVFADAHKTLWAGAVHTCIIVRVEALNRY